MPSAICQPTVNTGFSAVDGSWKTMATSRPRIWRSFPGLTLMTLLPLISTAPRADGSFRQQAQDGLGRDGLAGAGLADNGEHLPCLHLKAHVLDRVDVPGVCGERDLEVVDVQHGSGAGRVPV